MPNKLNNNRVYPSPAKQPRYLDKLRKEEAKERQEAYNKLSPQQKLTLLDEKKLVAKKQRAKLKAQIVGPVAVPSAVIEEIEALNQSSKRQHLKAKDRRKQEKNHD